MRTILILITAFLLTQPAGAAAQISVSVEQISDLLVDLERRAPADVKPLNSAQISAEVSAVVMTVHADVGQRVSAGELLIELESRDFELNLNRARANLATSQTLFPRPEMKEEWLAPPVDQSDWQKDIKAYEWDPKTGFSPRPIVGQRGGELC